MRQLVVANDGAPLTEASARWKKPPPRRVRAIRDRLRLVYGTPQAKPHGQPLAELVLTVLSQSTNDRNRDVAYLALRERFPTWEAVRDAPVDEVEEAIRPGGISRVKSARIKSILRAITETEPVAAKAGSHSPGSTSARSLPPGSRYPGSQSPGSHSPGPHSPGPHSHRDRVSLDWLTDLSVEEAQRYLCGLPGVGRKTAACVLLFALGMRDVPVDTHVSRVGTRLALLPPGAPFPELHDTMVAITPPGEELEFHLNLLRHGRRTCYARRPHCAGCALQRMCPSAFKVG